MYLLEMKIRNIKTAIQNDITRQSLCASTNIVKKCQNDDLFEINMNEKSFFEMLVDLCPLKSSVGN